VRNFGCECCYGEHVPTSWQDQMSRLEHARDLASESRLAVSLCAAARAGSHCVRVDGVHRLHGGDDAQYTTLVPIDQVELAGIERMGDELDLDFIGALGRDRRRLDRDLPTRKPGWLGWRSGPFPIDYGH
jgi:hypothetical protein